MNLKDQEKRLQNFKKMKIVVNANRSISLIEIYKISKRIRQNYNILKDAKYFIENIADNLEIESNLTRINKHTETKLWIYITEEQKYTKDFYLTTEKVIQQTASKDDIFIAIGQNAYEFLINNNYQVIKQFHKGLDQDTAKEIAYICQVLVETKKITKANILLHTNKVKNSVLTIYPMNEINFKYKTSYEPEFDLKNKKFYPDINVFLKTQENIFLESILKIALLESSFVIYKNKIIQENKTLKEIDNTILDLRKTITKIKQELELEELVLLTSNDKEAIFNYDKVQSIGKEKK